MPTSNARGHVIPTGTEASFSRTTIFGTFGNSIRDVVPVTNTTDRASKVSALTSAGQGPSSARPLVVYRHDAPGVNRIEWTIDGTVWIPASGQLSFASKAAADSWATSNGAYLTVGDKAIIAGGEYRWGGTDWQGGWVNLTLADQWANQGTYPPARARVDASGCVHIQGQIIPPGGYNFTQVFATLPTGMRPAIRLEVPVINNNAATRAIAGVLIDTNGNMNLTQAGVGAFSFGNTVISTV